MTLVRGQGGVVLSVRPGIYVLAYEEMQGRIFGTVMIYVSLIEMRRRQ